MNSRDVLSTCLAEKSIKLPTNSEIIFNSEIWGEIITKTYRCSLLQVHTRNTHSNSSSKIHIYVHMRDLCGAHDYSCEFIYIHICGCGYAYTVTYIYARMVAHAPLNTSHAYTYMRTHDNPHTPHMRTYICARMTTHTHDMRVWSCMLVRDLLCHALFSCAWHCDTCMRVICSNDCHSSEQSDTNGKSC